MRFFMCKPTYFDVIHKGLNAHMNMQRNVDKTLALVQYTNLTNFIRSIAVDINFIYPKPELVDMVFAANGALIDKKNKKAVVASFAASPRINETKHWKSFLESKNYNVCTLNSHFEGQGDALFSHNNSKLWVGHGFRTSLNATIELKALLPRTEIFPLKLVDPLYYHLDTCFCVLNETSVMYYPPAFDEDSLASIKKSFKTCIIVSDQDARNFACNAVEAYGYIILHNASVHLKEKLETLDLNVIEIDMSEFLLSGGSVKCCILHT